MVSPCKIFKKLGRTIRYVNIRDIRIMRSFPSPQADSRWTAQGNGAVMVLEKGAFVKQVLPGQGSIVQGVHMQVLIISQDEDNIWPARRPLGGAN